MITFAKPRLLLQCMRKPIIEVVIEFVTGQTFTVIKTKITRKEICKKPADTGRFGAQFIQAHARNADGRKPPAEGSTGQSNDGILQMGRARQGVSRVNTRRPTASFARASLSARICSSHYTRKHTLDHTAPLARSPTHARTPFTHARTYSHTMMLEKQANPKHKTQEK